MQQGALAQIVSGISTAILVCRIRPLRILGNERYPVTVRYYYDDYSGEHRGIEVGKMNYRVKCISKPRSD